MAPKLPRREKNEGSATQTVAFSHVSIEEARPLYEVAVRVKELAPWAWMEESDLFGVQNPETGELGFVSVMGMAGEHFAIGVYQGAEGLYGFRDLESGDPLASPMQLLEIPQLQASFEDRDLLEKEDRDLIKQLGLKFRGANAWPMFRSYRPGFLPWFVTGEEARFLTYALAQTLDVAPRLKENPDLLYAENDDDDQSYLVRAPRQTGDRLDWEDQIMRVPPPEPVPVPVVIDIGVISQLKQLSLSNLELEMDLFTMPTPIREKGERPYLPYVLMTAEGRSGLILGFEILKPENNLSEKWRQIPTKLSYLLAQAGGIPREIKIRSDVLFGVLNPLAKALNIKLRQTSHLPAIDNAAESMFDWMSSES